MPSLIGMACLFVIQCNVLSYSSDHRSDLPSAMLLKQQDLLQECLHGIIQASEIEAGLYLNIHPTIGYCHRLEEEV